MYNEWYAPGSIRFTKRQTLWLIWHLGTLQEGKWPPEASNYVDIYVRHSSSKAAFVTPIEYAAEILTRLEECGRDGLILLAMECWGMSAESLAKYFKMPEWSIMKRRKAALGYVSSGVDRRWHDTVKRKGKTYAEFLKRRRLKNDRTYTGATLFYCSY